MIKQSIVILLILLHVGEAIAQKQRPVFTKELSLMLDNDAFMLKLKDGYYTNGVFIQVSKAKATNENKKIKRYELAQTMFTTGDRRAVLRNEEDIDRPYCGYLQAKYSIDWSTNKDQLLSWYSSIGVTGKVSLAQQLQDSYHKLIHLRPYPYWEIQLPNAIGFNTGIQAKQSKALSKYMQLTGFAEANLGMVYTNAKLGGYFTIGLFEKSQNSALFNNRIGTVSFKHKHELMLYAKPMLTVQGYNATTQGMLGFDDKVALTSKPSTFMYQQAFGIVYANQGITARFETNWQTKETPLQLREQRYGSIQFAYRIH
jgi:hypothetical protein